MPEEAVTTIGDWWTPSEKAHGEHEVSLDARFLRAQWKRCSITADAQAAYVAALVPTDREDLLTPDDVRSLVSYLANELLENTAKFSGGDEQPVSYRAWVEPEAVVVEVSNQAAGEQTGRLKESSQALLEGDASELYMARMEEAAESGDEGSGIGFLTLIMDYGVALAFRFKERPDGYTSVTVQAQISLVRG